MARCSRLVGRMLWVSRLQSSLVVRPLVDISTQLSPFAWPSGKGMFEYWRKFSHTDCDDIVFLGPRFPDTFLLRYLGRSLLD
jgi:hypothetical protein